MLCKKDFSFICLTGFLFSFLSGRTDGRLSLRSVLEGLVTLLGALSDGLGVPGLTEW